VIDIACQHCADRAALAARLAAARRCSSILEALAIALAAVVSFLL
jgi:hypothetical protein